MNKSRLADYWINVKLMVNLAYGNFSAPIAIMGLTLQLMILFKLNNVSMWMSIGIGVLVFLILLGVGAFIMKSGLYAREQSIVNQHNPEMMELIKQGRGSYAHTKEYPLEKSNK